MRPTGTLLDKYPDPQDVDSNSTGHAFTEEKRRDRSTTVATRFWQKVEKGESEDCWPWRGVRDADGYSRFRIAGKWHRAPRVALVLAKGPIPQGLLALHSCDNPPCCNPAHLSAGTQARNMRERDDRGRVATGERNGRAKLTAETVLAIRAAHIPHKVSATKLALRFNVNIYVVRDILNRVTWRGIEPEGRAAA